MNARYALINATTPRIVRRPTPVDGGREKKEKEKKGEKKSKKGQAEKKKGTNGSLNNFFER